MKLGMKVGRGPGQIVLGGDPSLPPLKGSPQIFGPCLLRPKGWMHDEAGTWHGGRPQPRRLCVRWEPSPLLPKGGGAPSPIFGPFLLWPNGCMHQNATWYRAWPRPRRLCVRWEPSPLPKKGAEPPSPIFDPFLLWPNGWMHQDATFYHFMEVGLSPGDFFTWGLSPPPQIFGQCLL